MNILSHIKSFLFILLLSANTWAQTSAVTSNTVPGGFPSDEKPAAGGSIVKPNGIAGGLPSDEKPAEGGSVVKPNGIAGGLPQDEKPADGIIGGPIPVP